MAFLKRLSGNIWSYLSPGKENALPHIAPQSAPPLRKRGRPPKTRKTSIEDVVRQTKSMSPVERVDSWRVRATPSEAGTGRKRKAPITPSTQGGRRRKILRMSPEDEDYEEEDDEYDNDVFMSGGLPAGYTPQDYDAIDGDNINVGQSPSPGADESQYDEVEGDTSLLVSDRDYESPTRKKIISPTKEDFARGVSTEELREQGWDDDHIVLIQKLARRGREPLLPNHWKFEWPFMPDGLFEDDNDAFISPVRGSLYHAGKALEALFEMGGHMRDRVLLNSPKTPEQVTHRMLKAYIKWADADSGLDPRTTIPLLVLECRPSHVPASVIQASARTKLAKLAQRYRDAFRVSNSIEGSPVSRASTVLSYPVPTLYAIIASGTLIALVAYNPADEDPDIRTKAFFQMRDRAYDVWNALALAMVVCHVRDVQIRVAEETGVGMREPGVVKDERVEDPDL